MRAKPAVLVAGGVLALWGMLSLPFGQRGVPKHTADLFVLAPSHGLFHSGGITLLALGLLLIFISALIPRR